MSTTKTKALHKEHNPKERELLDSLVSISNYFNNLLISFKFIMVLLVF